MGHLVPFRKLGTLSAAALLALAGCGTSNSQNEAVSITVQDSSPLAGLTFYADPQRPVVQAQQQLREAGRKDDAELLDRIASQPSALWIAGGPDDSAEVSRVTSGAAAKGQTALIVVYNLPHRDACGAYSSGGAPDRTTYLQWLNKIAGSIKGSAVVIVEPDAIADLAHGCLKGERVEERYGLLNDAIGAFKYQRQVAAVYLDAANPRWFADPSVLVEPLHRAGAHGADGVSVNVSNFIGTQENLAWVKRLMTGLDRLGGKLGAVIDTSRSGNGLYEGPLEPTWCNPPGRTLGDTPTTKVDAPLHGKLWVKIPGASDGACRVGHPSAGTFWLDYALGLARGNSPG